MNGTAGALSPPPAFLTVKGLEKPVPGLADRVARTLKTAMKDTSLLLLPCCCHAALSGSEVKNRAGGGVKWRPGFRKVTQTSYRSAAQ